MKITKVKGIYDILGKEAEIFSLIEETFFRLTKHFGYKRVFLPILEKEELFVRSVGDSTDIVEKEMYTFLDKGKRKVALRPEGTAGAVRAYIENQVFLSESYTKWSYFGEMFRYENPQAGRRRQFYQAGCEYFNAPSPLADGEVIYLAYRILKELNVNAKLYINSIGCDKCRGPYKTLLIDYLKSKEDKLCSDCQKRLKRNPLRVLDCKNPVCKDIIDEAPNILDHLCECCKLHFEQLKEILDILKVPYKIDPFLVRGLDYYTKTVFEFKVDSLGAQNTVLAGGRYDKLIKELGGPDIPALGFAMGVDRVALCMKEAIKDTRHGVILLPLDEKLLPYAVKAFKLLSESTSILEQIKEDIDTKKFNLVLKLMKDEKLRDFLVAVRDRIELPNKISKIRKMFSLADKKNFAYALIIGEEEASKNLITVKNLDTGNQFQLSLNMFEG
ncbi:MAG TPA: histidine--tRNA ligase [Desulfurobacteriaceae bacterium]|nr:histidine--tRNA ligase [Desulfurobacteriaceae bacterium]